MKYVLLLFLTRIYCNILDVKSQTFGINIVCLHRQAYRSVT